MEQASDKQGLLTDLFSNSRGLPPIAYLISYLMTHEPASDMTLDTLNHRAHLRIKGTVRHLSTCFWRGNAQNGAVLESYFPLLSIHPETRP
jgi:hypothetical protein